MCDGVREELEGTWGEASVEISAAVGRIPELLVPLLSLRALFREVQQLHAHPDLHLQPVV